MTSSRHSCSSEHPNSASNAKPNIRYILADDVCYTGAGFNRDKQIPAPKM